MYGEIYLQSLEDQERQREAERLAKESLDKRFTPIDWSKGLTTSQLDALA